MSDIGNRIGRAIKLDASLYEEVEHDDSALAESMLVVALSSIAAAIGFTGTYLGIEGLFWGVLTAFAAWFFWAATIYLVGGVILATPETRTDMGELLRVLGFASAPGMLRILGVFLPIQGIVFGVCTIWTLVATVIAVRQALDFLSTWRAVAVCVLGLVFQYGIVLLFMRMANAVHPAIPAV